MSANQALDASKDPVAVEEAYDLHCREEADGASDSECDDKEDADDFRAFAELQLDVQSNMDTEFHATNEGYTLTSSGVKVDDEVSEFRQNFNPTKWKNH